MAKTVKTAKTAKALFIPFYLRIVITLTLI